MQREDLLVGMAAEAYRQGLDGASDVLMSMAGGMSTGQAIERQEAQGQKHLVQQDLLPVRAPWDKLEALGFRKLDEGDGVLCQATLPEGWEKRASDHSMWSYIYDEQGRERASVFYKAAFYDQRARLSLTCRFSCGERSVGGYDNPDFMDAPCEGYVQDCGADIWVSEEKLARPADRHDREAAMAYYDAQERLRKAAAAWLAERYPDCDDPLAYWGEATGEDQ